MDERKRKASGSQETDSRTAKMNASKKIFKFYECELDGENRVRSPSGTIFPIQSDIREKFTTEERSLSESDLGENARFKETHGKPVNRKKPSGPKHDKRQPSVKELLSAVNMNSDMQNKEMDTTQSNSTLNADEDLVEQLQQSHPLSDNSTDSSMDDEKALKSVAKIVQSKETDNKDLRQDDSYEDEVRSDNSTSHNEFEALYDINQKEQRGQPVIQSKPAEKMEINEDENPQIVGVASLMAMFEKLKDEISSELKASKEEIKQEFRLFRTDVSKQVKKQIDTALEKEKEKNKKLASEVDFWKLKTETLTDVCNRMQVEMDDVTTRIENLELNNAKRMVIISGLSISGSKFRMSQVLTGFFDLQLGIQVNIDDCFTVGSGERNKPVVVVFQSCEEKRLVMRCKHLLKTDTNTKNVFINDYLPPFSQEKRRHEKDIIQQASPDDPEESFDVQYTDEGLAIQGTIYKKIVRPPTPKQLVDVSVDELERILNMEVTRGLQVTHKNSKFVGYTTQIDSLTKIKELYKRMKLVQPGARHIVCAYILDQQNLEQFFTQDYQDDGEPGAGRALLDFLRVNDLKNRVIFVARKYGGVKMGVDRFECYLQAAKNAVQEDAQGHHQLLLRPPPKPKQQKQKQANSQIERTGEQGGQTDRGRGQNNIRQARPATTRQHQSRQPNYTQKPQQQMNTQYSVGVRRPFYQRGAYNNQFRAGSVRRGNRYARVTGQPRNGYGVERPNFQFSEPEYIPRRTTEHWSAYDQGGFQDNTNVKEAMFET